MLLTEAKKSRKENSTALVEESGEESAPVDLLVDVIIGFLEKSTTYMRTVGNQVFSLLSESVKDSTIDLIVTVRCSISQLGQLNSFFLATGTPGSISASGG